MSYDLISECVVAVDGGGTKTEAAAVRRDGSIAAYVREGASNPNDIGEDNACGLLVRIIERLHVRKAEAFCAGLSGATGHSAALCTAVGKAADFRRVCVESDVYNLFGLEKDRDRDCAALICGTGAVCFYRTGGSIHRVGGWGYLLDSDCGGGFSIGRDGLEAVMRAYDGREAETSLTGYALRYLGISDPSGAIPVVYSGGKPLIAGFAPSVFGAFRAGDAAAKAVIQRNAQGLAAYLSVAAQKLGREFSCILSGGLTSEPDLIGMIEDELTENGLSVRFIVPDLPQLAGAAANAAAAAGWRIDPGFRKRFAEDYEECLRKKNDKG